jgi:hypothetical protein
MIIELQREETLEEAIKVKHLLAISKDKQEKKFKKIK